MSTWRNVSECRGNEQRKEEGRGKREKEKRRRGKMKRERGGKRKGKDGDGNEIGRRKRREGTKKRGTDRLEEKMGGMEERREEIEDKMEMENERSRLRWKMNRFEIVIFFLQKIKQKFLTST